MIAPMVSKMMGNTYKRNVKKRMGRVSNPMITWSPFLTSRVFLTVTVISFLLSPAPQLSLDAQASQAPDRVVVIQAVDVLAFVTIPFSVIMI